jgi:RNA polymerase sigma-70 factor (ECF subfamily)
MAGTLAAAFLAALADDAARAAHAADTGLAAKLDDLVARARADRPTLEVPAEAFVAHVARKASATTQLDKLVAADLYLACACARADPAALEALEAGPFGAAAAAVARGANPDVLEDAKQVVRRQLLTSDGTRPPGIADYAGRGALGAWLRVVLTRELVRLSGVARRHPQVDTDELAALPEVGSDPEVGYLKQVYRDEFKGAFTAALGALSAEQRAVLRYHFVERLSIDDIGVLEGVSRATAARRVAAARAALLDGTRRALGARLGVPEAELNSMLPLIESQIELSLPRLLAK